MCLQKKSRNTEKDSQIHSQQVIKRHFADRNIPGSVGSVLSTRHSSPCPLPCPEPGGTNLGFHVVRDRSGLLGQVRQVGRVIKFNHFQLTSNSHHSILALGSGLKQPLRTKSHSKMVMFVAMLSQSNSPLLQSKQLRVSPRAPLALVESPDASEVGFCTREVLTKEPNGYSLGTKKKLDESWGRLLNH